MSRGIPEYHPECLERAYASLVYKEEMSKPAELPGSEFSSAKTARIAVLGSLRLETAELSIDSFGSRHAATILAILALHSEPVSRSRLGAELWPGELDEVLRPRLRQELFRLKKALGEWSHLVTADREFVALRRLCVSTDVEEFLAQVQAGRTVEGERRIELWSRAAEIYKDDILVDYDGDWLSHERSSLQGIRRRLLLNLVQLMIDQGRAADAVKHARTLIRHDSMDEAANAALAQAMHYAGDTSAAHEHLRRFEARLKSDGRSRGESLAKAWRTLETAPESRTEAQEPAAKSAESRAILGKPLPVALHPMFGREREVERILAQSEGDSADPRLLTIVGFGGMGKTRLAVEVARQMSQQGKRLVGFVSLIEVDDPDVMIQNIAVVVCPSREQSQDLFSTIASELDGKNVTLILDNFEDLVPCGNSMVERLLNEIRGLRLLITSRTPLGLLGEQVFPLSPLPRPSVGDSKSDLLASPSVALFLDQTMRVRPEFELDEETLTSIVKLIEAVEGIPLAILLAACRMRSISPQEAERAIQDRLSFLVGPKGGFEERHRTMRACIEWSSDALPVEVRDFWKKLAIFHGGWTLEAAEAVLEERNALDYLEMLGDSSLVLRQQAGGTTRYAMFEPVRQYADELLQPADRERAGANHAKFFVEFVEASSAKWHVTKHGRSFDAVEAAMDNVRSALNWSLTNNHSYAQRLGLVLRVFWADSGRHGEGRLWLDRLLGLPQSSWLPRERILIMLSAGIIVMDQADYARSRALYLEAHAICEDTGDENGGAWIDLNLSYIDVLFGFVEKAIPVQERALAAFERLEFPTGIAHASTDLGLSLLRVNQQQRSLDLMKRALAMRMDIGWENGVAFAEAGLGAGLLKLGHLFQAYEHLDAAYHICRRTGDVRILLDVLTDLSECCLELGRIDESASTVSELHDLCRRVGDQLGSVNCDIRSASYELMCGQSSVAIRHGRHALDSALKLGIPLAIIEALRVFSAIARRLGMPEASLRLALGIEHIRAETGIASWPRRDQELEALALAAEQEIDLPTKEGIRSQASQSDIESLVRVVEEIERSASRGVSSLQ
jgi:predicted ATPase/DNA-binding SARP family transcriptional activator